MMFDRSGYLLDEFDGTFARAWGINMVTECKFTLPALYAKNTEINFEFGNHIVVMNDDGMPEWVGRMETPRGWGNKTTKQKAISEESIFADRIGRYTRPYYIFGTAGSNLLQIIHIANAAEDTLIQIGDLYRGGLNTITLITASENLSANIDQILNQSRCEYEIVPVVTNNRLQLYANLYAEMGVDTGASLNDSNCRIEENSLSENGPIKNLLVGVGKEQQIRNRYRVFNQASIARYGLRESPYEVNAVEATAVAALTLMQLAALKSPRKTFRVTASKANSLYPLLRKGNRSQFESADVGYGKSGVVGTQATVRILGMAYSDSVDGVALTISNYD